jgi:hypothetical protein
VSASHVAKPELLKRIPTGSVNLSPASGAGEPEYSLPVNPSLAVSVVPCPSPAADSSGTNDRLAAWALAAITVADAIATTTAAARSQTSDRHCASAMCHERSADVSPGEVF